LGALQRHRRPSTYVDGNPYIQGVLADENSKKVMGEVWHTDLSYLPTPPKATALHLFEVPPVGGDTLFASMYEAYNALSDNMKRFLLGLTAVHDGARILALHADGMTALPSGTSSTDTPSIVEHPVVCVHPATHRPFLFVNSFYTRKIVELREQESASLLQFLFHHVETPEFQYRLHWEKDTISVWDNLATQHHAVFDYFPHRRRGHRIAIEGGIIRRAVEGMAQQ
jgi:taurine dioxygenase